MEYQKLGEGHIVTLVAMVEKGLVTQERKVTVGEGRQNMRRQRGHTGIGSYVQ